jgi:preprotein translocase subunit SecA
MQCYCHEKEVRNMECNILNDLINHLEELKIHYSSFMRYKSNLMSDISAALNLNAAGTFQNCGETIGQAYANALNVETERAVSSRDYLRDSLIPYMRSEDDAWHAHLAYLDQLAAEEAAKARKR